MPTYLSCPLPPQQRMGFMDALEEAGIAYSREPDGYVVYLKDGQQEAWRDIQQRFRARVAEEDPPLIFGM